MDGMALGTGLFGILVGAVALYHVMKRNWWGLYGILSIGAAGLLSLVTDGPRPPGERTAVLAAEAALLVSFLIALAFHQLRARRRRAATARL